MKIGLCDVDGHNFPNLPLMKLSAYHKKQGDQVEWVVPIKSYDIVYKSKVFTFTPDLDYCPNAETVIEGGTGYTLEGNLPDQIEHSAPDYSLYPAFPEAYGFLTRGCPRRCPFCIVAQKEGDKSRRVAEVKEFWSGQDQIKLLDPNLLACAEHEAILRELAETKAQVDFTQGLDVRFTNEDNLALLKQIKVQNIHFAWDNPRENLAPHFEMVKRVLSLNERKQGVYILTNYNTTFDEDLMRVYKVLELGFTPFVMIYNKGDFIKGNGHLKPIKELLQRYTLDQINHFRKVHRMQRWANAPRIWRSCPRFEDYSA